MFNSNISVQCVDVEIIDDSILEFDETFFVSLEVSDTNVLLENQAADIVIGNNDGECTKVVVLYYIYTIHKFG